MSVRALFSSLLLALVLVAGVTAGASAATKAPTAKIALGAHKTAAKKAKKKKAKKARKAKKRKTVRASRGTNRRTAPQPADAQPAAPTVAAPPAPSTCANTGLIPDAANLELVREAIVCLHNLVRAQHGLRTLAPNAQLAVAATGHSADMIGGRYFGHTTPSGGTFVQRILAARYAAANAAWTLGENLAWGTSTLATPAGMMQAWLNSPGHRQNLLNGEFREIGVGIGLGTPTGAAGGATVAVEFGARG